MKEKTKVSIVRIEKSDIYSAVEGALDLISFDCRKLKKRVIIKPNLISTSNPKDGKTTDSRAVDAVVKLFRNKKINISIEESVAYGVSYLIRKTPVSQKLLLLLIITSLVITPEKLITDRR